MKLSTMTTKGLVLIPAEIRRRHNLRPGTRIAVTEQDDAICLTPLTKEMIYANIGFLKTKGRLLRALAKEKRIEREL
jgi:AbrB family looped-hinge helix DNA binding protein